MTWECDSNRHMNVMYYVNKFEHAGRHFFMELGTQFMGSESAIGVVALEQTIQYHKEVFEDNLLYIESDLVEIGNKAFTLFHKMHLSKTQELVATMKVVLVLFDKVKRKAMPFPEDLKAKLLGNEM